MINAIIALPSTVTSSSNNRVLAFKHNIRSYVFKNKCSISVILLLFVISHQAIKIFMCTYCSMMSDCFTLHGRYCPFQSHFFYQITLSVFDVFGCKYSYELEQIMNRDRNYRLSSNGNIFLVLKKEDFFLSFIAGFHYERSQFRSIFSRKGLLLRVFRNALRWTPFT